MIDSPGSENPLAAPAQSKTTDTTRIIYSMIGVSRQIEKRQVLKDISLSFYYGAKIGVLGLNGSGKSTLLRIMAGIDTEYEGRIERAQGYSVGYLEQEPLRNETRTVLEVVREGAAASFTLLREFDEVSEKLGGDLSPQQMEKLLARQGELQEKIDAADAWSVDSQLEQAMDALRCPAGDMPLNMVSGGEKRRVALTRLLLQKPAILLLDEPTNHLDAESVSWLEHHLAQYEGTVIAVTHDRYFLDNVAGWILELDRGVGFPYKGNYTGWLQQKHRRLQVEEKQESVRQKTLARELEWIRQGQKGRQAKSKARISNYERMVTDDSVRAAAKEIEIFIAPGPRLGNIVIDAKSVTKAFGDNILLDKASFSIPPGAIVGIIGPNGAGKTTLFRMILGREKPDGGEFRVGDTVTLGYVEQGRDSLPAGKSIWESISDGAVDIKLGPVTVNSRAYVARFGFTGAEQQRSVETLSGGERNRVHLARMLRQGANVILLDEPTNDLDVNTLRALEEAIENFVGTVVIISHDRWFLDRLATHIIAFEGESQVAFFTGNWTEYDEDRHKRLGAEATPHRLKYRKLTRA
ncbi:MAG: energy-dependent translational throttle protein EttA [Phycisphaerales bacterium]|nr:energy-dependent translational throttle protein EttA [Phycisphaerales bacterium]